MGEIIIIRHQQGCNNIIIGGDLNTSLEHPDLVFRKYLDHVTGVENLQMCINSTHGSIIDFIVSNSWYTLHVHVSRYENMHDGDVIRFNPIVILKLDTEVPYSSARWFILRLGMV